MSDLNLVSMTLAQGASATDALQSAAGAAPSTAAAPAPAATTVAPGTAPAGSVPVGANQPSMWPMMVPLILLVVMMIVFQTLGGRREKKKRAELMASMKRGDRVLTVGGILGTVDSVRDDEVILKVDPNTNAKMTFTKSSIQHIVKSEPEASGNGQAPAVEVKSKGEKAYTR